MHGGDDGSFPDVDDNREVIEDDNTVPGTLLGSAADCRIEPAEAGGIETEVSLIDALLRVGADTNAVTGGAKQVGERGIAGAVAALSGGGLVANRRVLPPTPSTAISFISETVKRSTTLSPIISIGMPSAPEITRSTVPVMSLPAFTASFIAVTTRVSWSTWSALSR